MRLLKVAVPQYKVPSRTSFSKTQIPKLYNEVRADVMKSLSEGTFLAATTDLLEEWMIRKSDLVSITTDNATNMVKAFKDFPDLWLGCFGHNLNLAISKALKLNRVKTAVKVCQNVVQGFSQSWKRRRGLAENQAALSLPKKALIHDVVTQWGSTNKMVERFLQQQQAICAALAAKRGAWAHY